VVVVDQQQLVQVILVVPVVLESLLLDTQCKSKV
jgi:hypothetical protein